MKRLFKHFTTDTRPCGCSRHATAQKCPKCAPKISRTIRPITPTADTAPRVDLNEIHRRFWARLRGEE